MAAMKGIRIKVAWDGALFVEGGRLSEEGLETFIHEAKREGACLVCYREGVGREPSDPQKRAIDDLKATGLELVHPIEAPPEWGPLQQFELELTPNRFRLSAVRGENMMFAYTPDGADRPLTYVFKGVGEGALQNLDLLISSNRIVESKARAPERAFCEDTLEEPGFHLRFTYADGKVWQGFFGEDEVPQNFENLYLGCRSLGLHVVKASVDDGLDRPQEGSA